MLFSKVYVVVLSLTTSAYTPSHSAFLALVAKAECGYLPVTGSVALPLSETIF